MPWNNNNRDQALDRAGNARRDHEASGHGGTGRRASEGETRFGDTRLPDGSIRTTYPDGSVKVTDADAGTIIKTDTDGTVSIEFTNGAEDFARVVFHPDGSTTVYDPNGHSTYIPKDGWLTDDGVAERLPDGTVREVEEDGDVHYTNPDGTAGGGYDASDDATTVVGDGWITTLFHDWGWGIDLVTNPLDGPAQPGQQAWPQDGAGDADCEGEDAGDTAIDPELEAWIAALEAAEAAAAADSVLDQVAESDAWQEQVDQLDAWLDELDPPMPEPAPAPLDPSPAEQELRERLGGMDRYETPRDVATPPQVTPEPEPVPLPVPPVSEDLGFVPSPIGSTLDVVEDLGVGVIALDPAFDAGVLVDRVGLGTGAIHFEPELPSVPDVDEAALLLGF